MHWLGVAGRRERDIEAAIMAARSVAGAAGGGVGFAGGQDFFNLAHDGSLRVR
ncbi:hypothetical protein D3C87_2161180 [compost metagenome]